MAQTYSRTQPSSTKPSGWAIGWMAFAAFMMLIQGLWWLTAGFIAVSTAVIWALTVHGRDYVGN